MTRICITLKKVESDYWPVLYKNAVTVYGGLSTSDDQDTSIISQVAGASSKAQRIWKAKFKRNQGTELNGKIIAGINGYPVLILNDHEITSDSITWKDIDPKKDMYTKEELSHLYGIKADKIKKIQYYRDSEAYEFLGDRVKSGIIVIRTRKK